MNGMKNKLSKEDIKSLAENPCAENKVRIIEKLSEQYNMHELSKAQIELAEQIFRLLINQAEIEVRKALSENIMSNDAIPHDVVFTLAKDVEEVSLPVLEFSEVLTDEDLIEIITSTKRAASHIAIANRNSVSATVSSVLVNTNNEDVVDSLLQNEGANISDDSFEKIVSTFASDERIVESMITRGSISSKIITRMTEKVSASMQKELEHKYKSSFSEINDFFKESGEIAAFKFIGMQTIDTQLLDLIDYLEKANQLESSLDPVNGMLSQLLDGLEQLGQLMPLSALAQGHDTLFEITIARLTSVPLSNIHKLVLDKKGGFQALYDRAELPPKLFDVVEFAIDTIYEMKEENKISNTPIARKDRKLFVQNMVNKSKDKRVKNLAHLISVINHHLKEEQDNW